MHCDHFRCSFVDLLYDLTIVTTTIRHAINGEVVSALKDFKLKRNYQMRESTPLLLCMMLSRNTKHTVPSVSRYIPFNKFGNSEWFIDISSYKSFGRISVLKHMSNKRVSERTHM